MAQEKTCKKLSHLGERKVSHSRWAVTLIDLRNEFEKIVDNWEKITLFVKTDHDKDHIIKEIMWHIEQKQDLFFIFAYGSAIQHTIELIAKLRNDGLYQGKYLIDGRIDIDGAGKEKYRCIFETIKL